LRKTTLIPITKSFDAVFSNEIKNLPDLIFIIEEKSINNETKKLKIQGKVKKRYRNQNKKKKRRINNKKKKIQQTFRN
jgi:hypothetical protein